MCWRPRGSWRNTQNHDGGRLVSDLIRQALTRPSDAPLTQRNDFWVLPKRGGVVTTELVTRLAEDES